MHEAAFGRSGTGDASRRVPPTRRLARVFRWLEGEEAPCAVLADPDGERAAVECARLAGDLDLAAHVADDDRAVPVPHDGRCGRAERAVVEEAVRDPVQIALLGLPGRVR